MSACYTLSLPKEKGGFTIINTDVALGLQEPLLDSEFVEQLAVSVSAPSYIH